MLRSCATKLAARNSWMVLRERVVIPCGGGVTLGSAAKLWHHSGPESFGKPRFDIPDPAVALEGGSSSSSVQLTKIVATIGPTSEQAEPLYCVTKAGMRIMRLNFSHATREEVELRTTNLHAAQKRLQPEGAEELQSVRAVLLDTKGPEIRTGKLKNDLSGHETVALVAGHTVTLHTTEKVRDQGSTATDLYVDYPSLAKALEPGRKVLLDDGTITLTVQSINSDGTVTTLIENSGDLRSRAGVNLPLADTSDLPAMSDKDKADIKYGMTMDIDFVAASFVQSAEGVRQIRQHIQQCADELGWDKSDDQKPLPAIIAKIETASALKNFDEILAESDGIMVARGDLGVEIPLTQVTNVQKDMVAACNAAGKPVIVATQMLESMAKNPRPTRAEVADVTNAVYDGADCVMTSGETAKGKFPIVTIRTMNEIILASERYMLGRANNHEPLFLGGGTADSAVAKAAVAAAKERGCVAILVLTHHGTLPPLVAAYRPSIPIYAFCPTAKLARRLQIYRAIHPIVGLHGVPDRERAEKAVEQATAMNFLHSGEEVVVVSMDDTSLGRTATMKIAVVP